MLLIVYSTESILSHELLPEHLIDPCVEVLKQTVPSGNAFMRMVVEIINGLRSNLPRGLDTFQDEVQVSCYPRLEEDTTQH